MDTKFNFDEFSLPRIASSKSGMCTIESPWLIGWSINAQTAISDSTSPEEMALMWYPWDSDFWDVMTYSVSAYAHKRSQWTQRQKKPSEQ